MEDPEEDEEPVQGLGGIHMTNNELCVYLDYNGEPKEFVLKEAYLAFFNGRDIKSRFLWKQTLNRALAHFIQGYTHVEFAFRFVDIQVELEIWVACLIFQGERLHLEFKTHDYLQPKEQNLWTLFPLNLDKSRLHSVFKLCLNDVQRNLSFNSAMYYNFFVPRCMRYKGELSKSTFCSEHVATLLQTLQVRGFEDIEPHSTDPLMLYQQVLDCGLYRPARVSKRRLQEVMDEGGLIVQ